MAEPIIIKGGSLNIVFEDAFNGATATGKKSFTHKNDVTLDRLVITRNGKPDQTITLDKRDEIRIYYDDAP